MSKIDEAIEKITAQQSGHSEDIIFYVGEQLKDICRESEETAELVSKDLDNAEMSIVKLEVKIHNCARANGGCTPPQAADRIIREFYGIGAAVKEEKPAAKLLSLEDFI